jgi:hypothetical protein
LARPVRNLGLPRYWSVFAWACTESLDEPAACGAGCVLAAVVERRRGGVLGIAEWLGFRAGHGLEAFPRNGFAAVATGCGQGLEGGRGSFSPHRGTCVGVTVFWL